jgi:SAM-dependent methyltransferase
VNDPDREAETRRIAASASDGEPTAWFEQLYASARSGHAVIPWDRGGPHPLLAEWTEEHAVDGSGQSAVVVGCGLGADAEHLAGLGFETTAFDVSPTGVATATERHPHSQVTYTVADLFALPADWHGAFDLVFESLTVQSMPVSVHARAIAAVRSLVAPGGTLLVVSARRDEADEVDGPPWPLTRSEIESFSSGDVRARQTEELVDQVDPSIRRWRAELHRDA